MIVYILWLRIGLPSLELDENYFVYSRLFGVEIFVVGFVVEFTMRCFIVW